MHASSTAEPALVIVCPDWCTEHRVEELPRGRGVGQVLHFAAADLLAGVVRRSQLTDAAGVQLEPEQVFVDDAVDGLRLVDGAQLGHALAGIGSPRYRRHTAS